MSDLGKGRPSGQRTDRKRTASTRYLSRIIFILTDINTGVSKIDLRRFAGLPKCSILDDALNWLVANKIVCKTNASGYNSGSYFYSINPKWKELRDAKEE